MADASPTQLPPVPSQPDPFNLQTVKHFVFNETGNIMMASTDTTSDTIQQSVRDVFAEVSVFFAAMTKAISQTVNPLGVKDQAGALPYYSLYNYDALESVLDGSGYFVHVNEEDISYATQNSGVEFSKEVFQAILGLATGSGALAFASAMISSMGQEGFSIQQQNGSRTNKVANIVFVCEYLLGMPIISAIVITADYNLVYNTFKAGPCFQEQSSKLTIVAHKDVYMFVTPAFIKQYAGDLNLGLEDPNYLSLIMKLQSFIERTPEVNGVWDVSQSGTPVAVAVPGPLVPGKSYAVFGQYLGQNVPGKSKIELSPAASALSITASGGWDDSGIVFKVANSAAAVTGEAINITLQTGTVLTVPGFTIAAGQ